MMIQGVSFMRDAPILLEACIYVLRISKSYTINIRVSEFLWGNHAFIHTHTHTKKKRRFLRTPTFTNQVYDEKKSFE